uniref:Uncharacterized protein n=1 Tax=Rhizophora mucronata TaxID=61149 RepID=A0A2P2QEW5_RHIMU
MWFADGYIISDFCFLGTPVLCFGFREWVFSFSMTTWYVVKTSDILDTRMFTWSGALGPTMKYWKLYFKQNDSYQR